MKAGETLIITEYGKLEAGTIQAGWLSAQWDLEDVVVDETTYKRIKNRRKGSKYKGYIHIEHECHC